jgi:hypothetical protein
MHRVSTSEKLTPSVFCHKKSVLKLSGRFFYAKY